MNPAMAITTVYWMRCNGYFSLKKKNDATDAKPQASHYSLLFFLLLIFVFIFFILLQRVLEVVLFI